jgi:hypothetical protein
MLSRIACSLAMLAAMAPGAEALAKEAPRELAGFVVGEAVEKHRDRLRVGSVLPVRFLESLKEAETVPLYGYKTGLVVFGTCIQPPRIIRLKFKYAETSKEFYDRLLAVFKQRFGEPDQWRGDPFGIVIAWKWSFLDPKGNDISLILQHNLRDDEEKQGNSIKLTLWNLMRAESACFESGSNAPEPGDPVRRFEYRREEPVDWDLFVPE